MMLQMPVRTTPIIAKTSVLTVNEPAVLNCLDAKRPEKNTAPPAATKAVRNARIA